MNLANLSQFHYCSIHFACLQSEIAIISYRSEPVLGLKYDEITLKMGLSQSALHIKQTQRQAESVASYGGGGTNSELLWSDIYRQETSSVFCASQQLSHHQVDEPSGILNTIQMAFCDLNSLELKL